MNLLLVAVASAEGAASLCLLSLMTAALSSFIDYCLDHHPIGIWYLRWLKSLPENIAKPLGECIYCSGSWLHLGIVFLVSDYSLCDSLISLGANHLFLRLTRLLKP